MDIIKQLAEMKEAERSHPSISNGKKKAKGLKSLNIDTSKGNDGVKKTDRQKYIAFLLGRRK